MLWFYCGIIIFIWLIKNTDPYTNNVQCITEYIIIEQIEIQNTIVKLEVIKAARLIE